MYRLTTAYRSIVSRGYCVYSVSNKPTYLDFSQRNSMNTDITRIERLMTLTTGDEKHDSSSRSTLDVLWVLYDRVMHYNPTNPRSEERDRFVLSKGHGCVAFYAVLADKGFFPPATLKTFLTWDS